MACACRSTGKVGEPHVTALLASENTRKPEFTDKRAQDHRALSNQQAPLW